MKSEKDNNVVIDNFMRVYDTHEKRQIVKLLNSDANLNNKVGIKGVRHDPSRHKGWIFEYNEKSKSNPNGLRVKKAFYSKEEATEYAEAFYAKRLNDLESKVPEDFSKKEILKRQLESGHLYNLERNLKKRELAKLDPDADRLQKKL